MSNLLNEDKDLNINKKLTADEIFEKYEFKKVLDNGGKYDPIEYRYEDGSFVQTIKFNQIIKSVVVEQVHDYTIDEITNKDGKIVRSTSLYKEVLEAINKKMKELGW